MAQVEWRCITWVRVADVFMKPLVKEKFEKFRRELGMRGELEYDCTGPKISMSGIVECAGVTFGNEGSKVRGSRRVEPQEGTRLQKRPGWKFEAKHYPDKNWSNVTYIGRRTAPALPPSSPPLHRNRNPNFRLTILARDLIFRYPADRERRRHLRRRRGRVHTVAPRR